MKQVKFAGIDSWNRPVFKDIDRPMYYGSVNILFPYDATEKEVLEKIRPLDLEFFGISFDCEPYGSTVKELEIIR